MNRRVLIAGLAIAVPVLVILAANLGRDPHRVKSPLVGRAAPSFALPVHADGAVLGLDDLRGKPVVVNFWATWCVPCHEEHRVLVEAARAAGDRVQFLGVVYDDTEDRVSEFLAKYGTGYPHLLDPGGKTAIAWGVYGVPESFFVDVDGTIVAKHQGPLDGPTLAANLEPLLRGSR